MSKSLLKFSQIALDIGVLALAITLAFLLRFDFEPPPSMLSRLLLVGPYVVAFEYTVLIALGVHRFSWRYIGLREATRIAAACAASTCALLAVRLVAGEMQYAYPVLRQVVIPFGVLAGNLAIGVLGIGGIRVSRRLMGERIASSRLRRAAPPPKRTVLIGAGEAGVLVARELSSRPDLALRAVAFVDDDPRKIGSVIHGIPVLGTTENLPELCAKHRIKQGLITMANVPGSAIRRINTICETAKLPVKIVPGVYEIVGGSVNMLRIRDVAIEDLLRRDPVELDLDELGDFVSDKIVMVTGSGGSIGSELCRQICHFNPSSLILVERSENALFNIHRELIALHPKLKVLPCIADITDVPRMSALFAAQRPHLVFHAAAHKHVPIMEWNPIEGVKNNVFGTRTVADLAAEHEVEAFVMISTDKAVNPSSVMGATKRAAELYVQTLAQGSKTRFVTVRFGNVLGSAGSVVPIFREQIAQGGPITITHPEMRRYFMTIPEACQLVLQAGAMGDGGELFVLDMGEPVKIVDLARDLIALSGLRDGDDIEIHFTGTRPGEKLFEELSTSAEHADKTRHPKIFVGKAATPSREVVLQRLEHLAGCVRAGSEQTVLVSLRGMVPEFEPPKPEVRRPEPALQDETAAAAPAVAVAQ